MPKYLCDFDAVNKIGNKICETSYNINISTNSYKTSINNELSSWEGKAKVTFDKSNNKHIQIAEQYTKEVDELGKFIIQAADSIESLDNELASLKI